MSPRDCKLSCGERKPVALSELQLVSRHLPVSVHISMRRLTDLVITEGILWRSWCQCRELNTALMLPLPHWADWLKSYIEPRDNMHFEAERSAL